MPTPRYSWRAVAVVTALAGVASCSTTHVLHLRDPDSARRMNEMVLSPGTIAEIAPIPGEPPPALKYDVVGPTTGGLLLSAGSGVQMFAQDDRIKRLETIDRSRGARDGALAVGVPAFFLGVGLTALIARSDNAQTGGSGSPPQGSGAAIAVGAVLLAVGVAAGALYGAVAGHRDVYIVQP